MNLVREVRKALGWSQERFARRVNRSTVSVRMYESGRRVPPDVLGSMLALVVQKGGLKALEDEIERYHDEHYRFEMLEASNRESPEDYVRSHRLHVHSMVDKIFEADSGAFLTVEHVLEVFLYWVKSGEFAGSADDALGSVASVVERDQPRSRSAPFKEPGTPRGTG